MPFVSDEMSLSVPSCALRAERMDRCQLRVVAAGIVCGWPYLTSPEWWVCRLRKRPLFLYMLFVSSFPSYVKYCSFE